jgi:hypothetical protein
MDSAVQQTAGGKHRMTTFPAPLPLTAFEEYMLRDDRPRYPMSIVARLRFTGQLDRRATNEALETVVARHPLLRAEVRKTPAGRLEWIASADRPTAISWIDDPGSDRLPSMRPINLFTEPGLRLWASADPQRSSLVLQVHHAACDGKAVFQALDDFVQGYACAFADSRSPIELTPFDPQTLRKRGRYGLTVLKYLRMLPAQLMGLSRIQMFFMQRPVPLLERLATVSGELPEGFPNVKLGSLEADEVQKLAAAVADAKVTANDWLLRDFFVAVDDFRARHQAAAQDAWIRISVPMNLRGEFDKRMPAANVVSMVFLDRRSRQIADSAGLLGSIHREMDSIRRRQLGLIFVVSLWGLRLLPGGMAKWVDRDCCEATCVLSNLGRAMADSPLPRRNARIVAGNVVLEGVDFFVPVRKGTAASMAMIYYAGGLNLCMHYDSRYITEDQADDLMATYLRKIRASIETGTRADPGDGAWPRSGGG